MDPRASWNEADAQTDILDEMDEQLQHPGPRLPEQAVGWLCGDAQRTVLIHGRPRLIDPVSFGDQGHDMAVCDEDSGRVPHRSVDVVVVDRLPDDLTTLARMLRPGGQLVLLHTVRDHRIPWARKLDKEVGATHDEEPAGALVLSPHFGFVDRESFRHWQPVNTTTLTALLSHELADDPHQASKIAAAMALYADYGRGADGMQLPWVTTCYRAAVVESVWETPHALDPEPDREAERTEQHRRNVADLPGEPTIPLAPADSKAAADSDDLLLIDFR